MEEMPAPSGPIDPWDAIYASRGMAHINRCQARSFSINIFKMNARDLIKIINHVSDADPNRWSIHNEEANRQVHREVGRHMHNFLAASKTLIDHTRQFIADNYDDTPVEVAYKTRVKTTFASNPVAKFVQDLRNYMLHKGLPPSHMFLSYRRAAEENGESGKLRSGVQYKVDELLKWNRWSAPAREYLEQATLGLNIEQFVGEYLEAVAKFHDWLTAEPEAFHANDLAQLRAWQAMVRQHRRG